jgi:tRNA modification GTPase
MRPQSRAGTIAAIATPPGKGGVGIVRISGPDAAAILAALVPAWPTEHPSHKLRLSRIVDNDGLIDESLAVLMRGPNSYTGEDCVELQCHGGPAILRRALTAALDAGARMARPGEFTERAFLNGRLDLTQAEAVADLVNATNAAAHKLALEHLEGSLGTEIRAFRQDLSDAMVLIESAIDFSHEEHVYQIERDEILERTDRVLAGLRELRGTFDAGRRQREGVRVVILGPTNAGKSTLFNVLHGTDRAIVTDIEGTTRDYLEEEIVVARQALRVVDTAGLRATDDAVESIGIDRSRQLGASADLVVWVVDRARPLSEELRGELDAARHDDRPAVVVLNKIDLADALNELERELLREVGEVVEVSLQAGDGVDSLRDVLAAEALELTSSEGVLISRARHLEAVVRAIEALERAEVALHDALDHELIALDVREALDALGTIVGHVSTDDILHRIFAEFCVGK